MHWSGLERFSMRNPRRKFIFKKKSAQERRGGARGRGLRPSRCSCDACGCEYFYRRSLDRISKRRRRWLRPLQTLAQVPCHSPTRSGKGDFPLSLPGHPIVTTAITAGDSHYRILEFSLPVAVLTTRFLSVMFAHFYAAPGIQSGTDRSSIVRRTHWRR